MKLRFLSIVFSLLTSSLLFAQNTRTVSGRIIDPSTRETLIGASVVVKGSTTGTTTDINGNFSLTVPTETKTLTVSYVGYTPKDVTLGASNNININLEATSIVTQDVTVTSTRVAENIKQASIQIEKMSSREIKSAASGDFYQGLANFKGVDFMASSFGFKILNLRGFGGTSAGRTLQLIDGVDNQAPGLNFPVGNLVGINDLDVQSVEVISGPASALYGPNAMQGVIQMQSKSPWDVQGLSLQIKGGVTTRPAPYIEGQFRYAQSFGKKNRWAFKLTGQYFQTKDWIADDDSFNNYGKINTNVNVTSALRQRALAPVDSPKFTLDQKDKLIRLNNWLDFNPVANPRNLDVHTPSYMEKEMTDYNTYSLKLGGELHFKVTNDIDLSYSGKFGMGSAIYQSVSRYQLRDIIFHQHKIELRGKNFYVRGYITADDAGQSYDIRRTAQYISRALISDYVSNFNTCYFDSMRAWTDGFKADNEAKVWMRDSATPAAIRYAESVSWQPSGTKKFDSLYNVIVKDPRGKTGTLFLDRSALYHLEGQYNFNQWKYIDAIVGANYRAYSPFSQGTIFDDSLLFKEDTLANGFPDKGGRYNRILVQEFGGIIQLSTKDLLKNHLKLIASARLDKNTNYPVQFSPRLGAVVTVGKEMNHVFRISYATAFKSPTLQEQYLNLDLGVIQLIGNRSGISNLYTYTSIQKAKEYYDNGTTKNLDSVGTFLQTITLAALKPEQNRSIDFGYRVELFKKRLFLDVAGYYSWYTNFIGFTRVARPFGTAGGPSGETAIQASIAQPTTRYYTLYQAYVNASTTIPAWGASFDVRYYVGRGITPRFNYTYADLKEDNLNNTGATILSGFNAPRHKFNIGLDGYKVWRGLGFSANFRWVQGYRWQSSFGDGDVPSYHTLDLQVNYEFEKLHSTIRLGGSNIYNRQYLTLTGGPRIGAMYYVSWTFDYGGFLKKKEKSN